MEHAPVIFVVDRNPIHRNLVKYFLEAARSGTVHTFPTGEECLYRLRKGPVPDFVITSFFTGDADGFGFLGSVMRTNPAIRVIFFDHFLDSDTAYRLIDEGACDFISKTADPETGVRELVKNLRYLSRTTTVRKMV